MFCSAFYCHCKRLLRPVFVQSLGQHCSLLPPTSFWTFYRRLVLNSCCCRTQWTAEGSVCGAVSLWSFVCVWNIPATAERICAKFTRKTCLVSRSDEFQGQRSRSPGTKKRHFSAISAACVRFVFGKTSLASSIIFCVCWFSALTMQYSVWMYVAH